MKIEDVRPADQSKTICALNHSDTIQNFVIMLGALAFGAWVVLPDASQAWIQEKVFPVASAMMTGAGFAAKWYNGKAKDGRMKVGDLFTDGQDGNPNPGDFAKHVILTQAQSVLLGKFFGETGAQDFPKPAEGENSKTSFIDKIVSETVDPADQDTKDFGIKL